MIVAFESKDWEMLLKWILSDMCNFLKVHVDLHWFFMLSLCTPVLIHSGASDEQTAGGLVFEQLLWVI